MTVKGQNINKVNNKKKQQNINGKKERISFLNEFFYFDVIQQRQ